MHTDCCGPPCRRVDLGPVMDPVQLAAQAVDLNLRLMRWRAAPSLDIDALARTKCLLLGRCLPDAQQELAAAAACQAQPPCSASC